jgi:hypothetical protein
LDLQLHLYRQSLCLCLGLSQLLLHQMVLPLFL